MALGFVNFSAGSVLTEAQIDGIMRQTVMSFSSASARDTALSGVLDEGMVVYLEDVNSFYFYTGSQWQPFSTQWTSFTPVWTNVTVGNGTNAGRYRYTQGNVDIKVRLTFGSTTAITGLPSFALPDSLTSISDGIRNLGTCWYQDDTSTDTIGTCQCNSGSTGVFLYTTTISALSATVPHTWATDDIIDLNISVRIV